MDFALTPEQQHFRCEVQAFFAEDRVQGILRKLENAGPREEIHPQQIYQWLGERGWLAANWPREYGGLARTPVEAAIVSEEMALAGVPDTVHVNTIDIIGTFLLLAGTEEQKRKFLLPMARGEMIASVLYTEPGAGSDLASLTSRAERNGDGFKIYGRKIYSLKSFLADYGLIAVRTTPGDNPYTSITLFIVPMKTEGVRVNPMWSMSNERFNEVLLDGVSVNCTDIIGQLDGGWELINKALLLERTGLDYYAKVRRWLNIVIDHVRKMERLGDPYISRSIATLQAKIEAGRLMAWHIITQQARGETDTLAAAMSKWYNTEFARSVTRLALEVEGLEGVLSSWDEQAPMAGVLEAAYRECPGLTISAGTSEIMLHIISTIILQTP